MRNAFADEITQLAMQDPRVVLLSGDIGNRLFNTYQERCGARFFNCGVAEANMMGMAAGMAMSGLRPVAYTITPFITTRCLEQIRVDVCYHHVPVVIVGVGSGLGYASLGATHHSCEDMGLLRMLPNMTVMAPADPLEVRGALRAALRHDGPVYIRIGKKGEPKMHASVPEIVIGQGIIMQPGDDVCLLSTGTMLPVVLEAARQLAAAGVSAQVVSMPTVKPLDTALLTEAFARFGVVTTIEEHSVLGGLGGSVAEWLADQLAPRARLVRIGTPDAFLHQGGEQDYARELVGLTAENIAKKTLKALHIRQAQ